jgi:hypothetical protein
MSRTVDRNEDMSARGRLRLIQQEDGDIIVAVQPEEKGLIQSGASVEFCVPGAGGGRSSHTLAALRALMDAMERDNQERPIGKAEDLAIKDAPALEAVPGKEYVSNLIDRLKFPTGAHMASDLRKLHDEAAEMLHLYASTAPAKQEAAPLAVPEDISYEIVQDDMPVASASGKDALKEIRRYAAQYTQDGPIEVFKVVRTPIDLATKQSPAAPTEKESTS